MTDEQRRKNVARAYLNVYLGRGWVEKSPCAHCGVTDVQAHHHDYSKPLEVVWLCRSCHLKVHRG